MKKIAIFVPCYNVAKRIRRFLQSFDEQTLNMFDTLICVNNASEDSTLRILKELKNKSPILKNKLLIFNNKKNYGLGGSHKILFTYLIENQFTHCLTIPSNYKGSPKEIANLFCSRLQSHPDMDIFVGKRTFNSQMDISGKILKKLGDNIADPLKHLLADYGFSDIGSRFLLLRIEVLERVPYKSLSDGSEFNLQLNVLLNEIPGFKMHEIPLKKWAFSKTDTSKLLRYNGKMIRTMTRYGLNKYFFQRSGWRLFADFPDNLEREYEII